MNTSMENLTIPDNFTTLDINTTDIHPLENFSRNFFKPAGVVSLIVATIGVVFNILNIIVLSQPKMRNAVNLLLTMMAVSEMLLLTLYIPFVLLFNVGFPSDIYQSFHSASIHSARFMLFYADASVFFHTSSSWLLITTACFRFIFVKFPLKSAKLCSYERAILAGVLTIAASLLVCIPNMLVNSIIEVTDSCTPTSDNCTNQTLYSVAQASKYATESFITFNFWFFTTVGKFIPATLLLIFTVFLVKVLKEAGRRKKRLQADSLHAQQNGNEHSQTTRMLLAVVFLFFLIEFPHGLLIIYMALSQDYLTYQYLGEMIDLITLLAFSLNLILYSTMSRQYRMLFIQLFTRKIAAKLRLTHLKAKYSKCSTATSVNPDGYISETCAVSIAPDTTTVHSVIGSDDSDEQKLVDTK